MTAPRGVLVVSLFFALSAGAMNTVATSGSSPVPSPPHHVIGRTGWHAAAAKTTLMKQNSSIVKLTIHHSGVKTELHTDERAALRGMQRFHQDERKWGDLAYHFIVGPSGSVYQGRDTAYAADTATNYKPTGHVTICVLGNFDQQRPTAAALRGLTDLICALLNEFQLTPTDIRTHQQLASTACPGRKLADWLSSEGTRSIQTCFTRAAVMAPCPRPGSDGSRFGLQPRAAPKDLFSTGSIVLRRSPRHDPDPRRLAGRVKELRWLTAPYSVQAVVLTYPSQSSVANAGNPSRRRAQIRSNRPRGQ